LDIHLIQARHRSKIGNPDPKIATRKPEAWLAALRSALVVKRGSINVQFSAYPGDREWAPWDLGFHPSRVDR